MAAPSPSTVPPTVSWSSWMTDDETSNIEASSDNDEGILDLNTDLIGVRRATKDLNIVNGYRPSWGCREAFREAYQNWRDGIMRSFNLDSSSFHPTYTDTKKVILIEVRHPTTNKLLGFIKFQYDKDGYCVGGLKMVNFKAALKYCHLGTGGTTKANDKRQTGQHGDGMKLSALVFRRNNFNIHYESDGFKWRFLYKKGSLACSLSRISEKSLDKMSEKAHIRPRTAVADPREDVCLTIGAPGTARTIQGTKTKADRPHVDSFKEWLTVTLDINPPQNLIRTKDGDLIRDPMYRSSMYLRGLLLPSGGAFGSNYAYGYNFIDGTTSSDRNMLVGVGDEKEGILKIWTAAMRSDTSSNSDVTVDYTKLLLSSINIQGDVMLNSEDHFFEGDIARMIWEKMLETNYDKHGRRPFYYSSIEGKDEVHIIEQSLHQNPVPIDTELWKILEKYLCCRTPKEELLHRFKVARAVEIPDTTFATHMHRILNCFLQSSPTTQSMRVEFVNGEHLSIDAGVFETTWKVHNKWLTWKGAHQRAFCEEDSDENSALFSCDHAVLQLWDIMLSQLIAIGKYPQIAADEGSLKSMVRSRLSQMPRSVQCSRTSKKNELLVTWKSTDSYQNKEKVVRVVLHRDACVAGDALRAALSHLQDPPCSCSIQSSTAVSDGVVFRGLDPGISYFPHVSREVEGAYIALPPRPEKPRVVDIVSQAVIDLESETIIGQGGTPDDSTVGIEDTINCQTTHLGDTEDDVERHDDSHRNSIGNSPTPHATSLVPSPVQSIWRRKNMEVRVREEQYALGAKIEHRSLDWGGGFPGSHDFYRTRDAPEQEIFILKPKISTEKPARKRIQGKETAYKDSKKPRTTRVFK